VRSWDSTGVDEDLSHLTEDDHSVVLCDDAPRKSPTDGDVRLIFSSERRFARIGSPDGRCRREPSREGLRTKAAWEAWGGFCSRKARGWIWKKLNFQVPDTRPQGPKKRKSDGRDRAVGHDQQPNGLSRQWELWSRQIILQNPPPSAPSTRGRRSRSSARHAIASLQARKSGPR
jgi:hypothetical protein